MIRCSDIHKSYSSVEVLKGVDLAIDKGEIVTILGPSGAGKSTLLHILGTLSAQDRGSVWIDNTDISQLSSRELARFRNSRIGFVFQFHHLLTEFTALENVCIPGLIARRPSAQVETRAKELLDMLGMSHRLDHKPSTMSGGEQQRVAVARALINNPSVIFADEPSGNLDSANRDQLHKLFFSLRDRFGYTIVIVTHDNQLAEMSDRQILLRDGIIVND